MTFDVSAVLIAHAEYDPRRYPATRKIPVKHCGAFPADGREDQKVDCKQSIDRAGQLGFICLCASSFAVAGNDLKRARQ